MNVTDAQVKTKHELEPVVVQPPAIDPSCELVACGHVCSVIGALATVNAAADVQPVDAVSAYCRVLQAVDHSRDVAAGHSCLPQRQGCAGSGGGRVRPRECPEVLAALRLSKGNGGARRQTWPSCVLPQGAAAALQLLRALLFLTRPGAAGASVSGETRGAVSKGCGFCSACIHVALLARVLLPVIALTGVGAGLGRLQCTRRGSGRARAGLRAHRLSPSSSRLLMLCANRSSATTSKKWRPRFGLLQRAVHVDVGV